MISQMGIGWEKFYITANLVSEALKTGKIKPLFTGVTSEGVFQPLIDAEGAGFIKVQGWQKNVSPSVGLSPAIVFESVDEIPNTVFDVAGIDILFVRLDSGECFLFSADTMYKSQGYWEDGRDYFGVFDGSEVLSVAYIHYVLGFVSESVKHLEKAHVANPRTGISDFFEDCGASSFSVDGSLQFFHMSDVINYFGEGNQVGMEPQGSLGVWCSFDDTSDDVVTLQFYVASSFQEASDGVGWVAELSLVR